MPTDADAPMRPDLSAPMRPDWSLRSLIRRTRTSRRRPSIERSSLTADIRPELLRGVRSDRALHCFGAPWASDPPEADFALSETVPHIDDFVSHDWKTGRWWKFTTLCIIYNMDAAMIASALVGVAAAILMLDSVALLPKSAALSPPLEELIAGDRVAPVQGCWCAVLCPVAFWATLFLWQRLPAGLLRRRRFLFVDTLCISQEDEALKREGICSLAGFLLHTDRIVLLWSPRYFTRLWCVYEVATWLHLGRDLRRSVVFAPCAWSMSLLTLHIGLSTYYLALRLHKFVSAEVPLVPATAALVFLLSLLPIHITRHLAQDLLKLSVQLGEFSVRNAECFCCANQHVHPETGKRLPCDRELVYDMLLLWYAAVEPCNGSALDSALDSFDKNVRTGFKEVVTELFSGISIAYKDCVMVSLPSFWFLCDIAAGYECYSFSQLGRDAVLTLSVTLVTIPCYLRLVVWSIKKTAKWQLPGCLPDTCVTLLVAAAGMVPCAVLWVVPKMLEALRNPWPQALVHLLEVFLAFALFSSGPGRAAASAAGAARTALGRALHACSSQDRTSVAERCVKGAALQGEVLVAAAAFHLVFDLGDDVLERRCC